MIRLVVRFITKTNEWYEALSGLKGEMFYLGLCFIPYFIIGISLSFTTTRSIVITGLSIMWIFLVGLWRLSFFLIKDYREYKNKQ